MHGLARRVSALLAAAAVVAAAGAAAASAAKAPPLSPRVVAATFVRFLIVERDANRASYLADRRRIHRASLETSVVRFARTGAFAAGDPQRESCARGSEVRVTCFRVHLVTHRPDLATRTMVGVRVTAHLTLALTGGRWIVSALRILTASQPVCGINAYNEAQRKHDLSACRLTIPFPK